MKIRTRLIVVLSVLAGLIAVVLLTAVTAFARLGGSVAQAVRENLRSIDACNIMMEALDQQDRGFLLLLTGQEVPGREAILQGPQRFGEALEAARANVTMAGEREKVETLSRAYAQLLAATRRFRVAPSARPPSATTPAVATAAGGSAPDALAVPSVADYVVLAGPHLVEVRDAIRELSGINHGGLEAQATAASRSGWRRSAWVVSIGILGLALAVLLGRRLYRSIAVPLDALSRGIAAIGQGDLAHRVGHAGRDELGLMAAALDATAERLAAAEAVREGKLRMHERLAMAVLDALDPLGIVVDRESRVVLVGRKVKERLGDDPLTAVRAGAGGLVSPGEIDRRLEELFASRPSQVPLSANPPPPADHVALQPVVGRGGSLLGALVHLDLP